VVVARGLEKEDLAQSIRLESRVEEYRPHRLGNRGAARLPRMHRAVAQGTQPVVKQPELGTLARPLPALEGNEPTLCHGREYSRAGHHRTNHQDTKNTKPTHTAHRSHR